MSIDDAEGHEPLHITINISGIDEFLGRVAILQKVSDALQTLGFSPENQKSLILAPASPDALHANVQRDCHISSSSFIVDGCTMEELLDEDEDHFLRILDLPDKENEVSVLVYDGSKLMFEDQPSIYADRHIHTPVAGQTLRDAHIATVDIRYTDEPEKIFPIDAETKAKLQKMMSDIKTQCFTTLLPPAESAELERLVRPYCTQFNAEDYFSFAIETALPIFMREAEIQHLDELLSSLETDGKLFLRFIEIIQQTLNNRYTLEAYSKRLENRRV